MVMIIFKLHLPLYAATKVETSLDMDKIRVLEAEIKRNIDLGYPSMNILVIKDNNVIYQNAFGYKNLFNGYVELNAPEHVNVDTMYDIASNTKMYATNFALQKLVYLGHINLSDKVSSYLPNFIDQANDQVKGKSDLTIKQILEHTTGFPTHLHYHNDCDLYSQDKATTIDKICITPLEFEPGTKNVYNDLDYMLLGYVIEEVTGLPLDVYVEKEIYQPLGLTHTVFNPLEKGFINSDFAATERVGNTRDGNIKFNNIREYTIQGEVNDEKAFYSMNGVSGHAGLFSNTSDLGILMQVMLNGGTYNDVKLFDSEVINQFITPSNTNKTFALGWRINNDYMMTDTFGARASSKTYGHTGWTGTITAIDPTKNMAVVILGNRTNSPVEDISKLNVFESSKLPISSYAYVLDMIWDATF